MNKLAALLLGTLGAVASSAALAADVVPMVVPVVAAPPPAEPAFDWTRAYVGVSLGSWRETDFAPHDGFLSRAMAVAGFNFELGSRFVVGVEGQAGANDFVPGGNDLEFEWAVLGRAGAVLGERALLYGVGGLSNGPNTDFGALLGGGVELAIGSRMSIRGEALILRVFGSPGIDHILVGGGVSFFFGR